MSKSILKPCTRIAAFGWILAGVLLATAPAFAQDGPSDFPTIPAALEKQLASRASNVNEVTLNKNMLNFGGQFLDSKKKDDRQAQQLIHKLDGIYVRDYDFDKPGAYTNQDLETIRRQFLGSQWKPMVHVRSIKDEKSTDVYVKMVNGEIHGMFVLDAEPKELNLVYISGSIDPKELGQLGGSFGIPKVNADGNSAKSSAGSAK